MSFLGRFVFFGWSSRDGRGAKIRLYDFFDHWLLGGRKEFDIAELRQFQSQQRIEKTPSPWYLWAFPFLFAGPPLIRMVDRGPTWVDVVLLILAVLFLVQHVLNRTWKSWITAPAFLHAMLRAQRCPRCAYPIADATVDPGDGCTICPECGAAWRMPDSKHSEPLGR